VFLIIIFQFFKLGFQKLFRNLKLEIRNSDPKKDSQILILALLASMVTILIHGLVDTPYFKNDLSILFWLIVGLTIYQNCDKICVTNNKGGRMTRLVIFDYDDTLVRSSEALYKIDSETAHALGLKILTRQEYFALWGKPHNEMIKALYPDVDIDCYLKKYQEIYSDGILQLFDEVKQVLSDLKNRGVKIALLSSKQGEYLEKSLKHLGIRNFFDYIHSAEDSAYHKPDPRVFEGILSYFGFRTDEVVYVGDQLIDFIAAKAAGINFIAMTTGINTKTDFEKSSCQYICNSLKKILLFI